MASKDLKNKMRSSTDDIKRLKREITALKNDISIKEKELLESSVEIKQFIVKLSVKLDNQEKKYIKNEKIDLNKLGLRWAKLSSSCDWTLL